MRFPRLIALMIVLCALSPGAQARQVVQVIESQGALQASKEAERLGLDSATRERFWDAWRKDITSASQPTWRPLVESCVNSTDPRLHIWGLARLVEAGEMDKVGDYSSLMEGVVESFRKGDPDWRNSILAGPGDLPGASFQIYRTSPFWAYFNKAVLSESDPAALQRLYAVWSWNGSVEDRELMAKVATRIAPAARGASKASPWEDARFWMVMDWLCEFGDRTDWDRITGLLPKDSEAYKDAMGIYGSLKGMPAFWGPACSRQDLASFKQPRPVLWFSMRLFKDEWARKLAVRGRFGFQTCTGHDGKTSYCRPMPGPWVAAATLTGVRQLSSRVFIYPGIEKDKWPESYRSVAEFVLK